MEHISNTQTLQRFSNLAVNNHNSVKSLNGFKPDELVMIRGQEYPKVAGRLRLAHESNASISIATEIVQYDGKIAVIKAVCSTVKGSFTGYGMSSVDRDIKLASAILELAETRAIARSLRFAGYGVEYTGAEEMSHLEAHGQCHNGTSSSMTSSQTHYTGNQSTSTAGNNNFQPPPPHINNSTHNTATTTSITHPQPTQSVEGDNSRLSGKQYRYLLSLSVKKGSKASLDEYCVQTFGSKTEYLTKKQASELIKELTE